MQTVIAVVLIVIGLLITIGIGYLVYNYLHHHPMRDTIHDLHNQLNMEQLHNISHSHSHIH